MAVKKKPSKSLLTVLKISNRNSFDNQELKKNLKNVHVNHSVDQITHVTHEYKAGRMGKIAIPKRNTQNSYFCAWSLVNLSILTLYLPCKNMWLKISGILGTILQIKRQLKKTAFVIFMLDSLLCQL